MFYFILQERVLNQIYVFLIFRDELFIFKGIGDGNWEYFFFQQMYNVLLCKGYIDIDVMVVESMVVVYNFFNEGVWGEIVEWECWFGKGLLCGWEVSKCGEDNVDIELRCLEVQEGGWE